MVIVQGDVGSVCRVPGPLQSIAALGGGPKPEATCWAGEKRRDLWSNLPNGKRNGDEANNHNQKNQIISINCEHDMQVSPSH